MSPTTLIDPITSKNICVSTPLHKRQVAMAPDSCGDGVLVVSSPYKRHTHSSASIQLGQQHLEAIRCNPWALRSCHKVGLGSKLHTTSSLQLGVAALLLRLTLRWMGNKTSEHLILPSIHAWVQLSWPATGARQVRKTTLVCDRLTFVLQGRTW